jgi:hypothetical protein
MVRREIPPKTATPSQNILPSFFQELNVLATSCRNLTKIPFPFILLAVSRTISDPVIERCIEKLTQVAHCRISTASGSECDFRSNPLREHRSLPLAVLIRQCATWVNFSMQRSIKWIVSNDHRSFEDSRRFHICPLGEFKNLIASRITYKLRGITTDHIPIPGRVVVDHL